MTIYEYVDIIGQTIVCKYNAGKWYATIEHGETKESEHAACIGGCFGTGPTMGVALSVLTAELQGKWLVINVFNKDRRKEFGVPQRFDR